MQFSWRLSRRCRLSAAGAGDALQDPGEQTTGGRVGSADGVDSISGGHGVNTVRRRGQYRGNTGSDRVRSADGVDSISGGHGVNTVRRRGQYRVRQGQVS